MNITIPEPQHVNGCHETRIRVRLDLDEDAFTYECIHCHGGGAVPAHGVTHAGLFPHSRCDHASVRTHTGKRGDLITSCANPDCHAVAPVAHVSLQFTTPPPAMTGTVRYVCRDHHDEPVNARGKGCRKCSRRRGRERTEAR